MILTELIEYML